MTNSEYDIWPKVYLASRSDSRKIATSATTLIGLAGADVAAKWMRNPNDRAMFERHEFKIDAVADQNDGEHGFYHDVQQKLIAVRMTSKYSSISAWIAGHYDDAKSPTVKLTTGGIVRCDSQSDDAIDYIDDIVADARRIRAANALRAIPGLDLPKERFELRVHRREVREAYEEASRHIGNQLYLRTGSNAPTMLMANAVEGLSLKGLETTGTDALLALGTYFGNVKTRTVLIDLDKAVAGVHDRDIASFGRIAGNAIEMTRDRRIASEMQATVSKRDVGHER